jgi:hypothetical protein
MKTSDEFARIAGEICDEAVEKHESGEIDDEQFGEALDLACDALKVAKAFDRIEALTRSAEETTLSYSNDAEAGMRDHRRDG